MQYKEIKGKKFLESTILDFKLFNKGFQVRVLKLYPNFDIPNHKEEGIENSKIYVTLKGDVTYLVKKHYKKGNNFIYFRSDNQHHKIKVREKSLILSLNYIKYESK